LEEKFKEEEKQINELEKNLQNTNGEIESKKKSLNSHNEKLEQIGKELEKTLYNEKQFQEMKEFVRKTKLIITNLNQEIGEIRKELSTLENAKKQQEKLQKELKVIEKRADNLSIMKSLFKSKGFVNYISSKYLQNLCDAANVRFQKLTKQALSLELNQENTFQVIDRLNGGKSRSIKTLSGGQTFQAALSLSLALADSVQKLNKSEKSFFFLDEGFGTLDQEALTTVFQTLKSLHKENKTVGIISHVEELKQEIGVYLNIEKDDERGSFVMTSY